MPSHIYRAFPQLSPIWLPRDQAMALNAAGRQTFCPGAGLPTAIWFKAQPLYQEPLWKPCLEPPSSPNSGAEHLRTEYKSLSVDNTRGRGGQGFSYSLEPQLIILSSLPSPAGGRMPVGSGWGDSGALGQTHSFIHSFTQHSRRSSFALGTGSDTSSSHPPSPSETLARTQNTWWGEVCGFMLAGPSPWHVRLLSPSAQQPPKHSATTSLPESGFVPEQLQSPHADHWGGGRVG